MDHIERLRALGALFATTTLLAACGGGGSSSPPPPPPPPPPPASVSITGKAVDGALQGATACYDLNDNGVCDSGTDPASAATDASGAFTLTVLASDAGKHRVIVNVPATAIDADTGAAVGKAFTLVAPASGASGAQSIFVSPLTTLVHKQMELTGQSAVDAAAFVQQQAGMAVSPLSDFTAATGAAKTIAANVAKLVLQASLQQATAVASVVGQTDISGATITQAALDANVVTKVIEALPSIGAAAVDPAVTGLTGTARETALAASAGQIVTSLGFTPEQAKFVIGLPKLPPLAQSATPEAGASLIILQYTDANHWFMRANESTALDNTPDANGLVRFFDVRTRMAPYAYQPDKGVAESFTRTTNPELFWNGSAWTKCKLGDRFTSTQRDALGRNSYNYCDNNEKGNGQRAEIDISGRTLADVWTNTLLPEAAKTTAPGNWSLPNNNSVAPLGSATFPAGSRLRFNTNTTTETAITYNTIDSNRVDVAPLAVAQGGDARSGSPACATDASRELLGTLETLVARNLGMPCIFNQQTNDTNGLSLTPNEVWGTSTVSMGTLATNVARPDGTSNYYTTTRLLRVSFPSAGNTVYWSCLQRTTNNGTRNCTQVGSGTYTIATLGDARVMTFGNLPAAAQALNSTRVFVERGGQVYFGFKNRVGQVTSRVEFNLAAAQAMMFQLGLPRIQPADAPKPLTGAKATTMAIAKGVWGGSDGTDALILRVGDNGEYLLAEVGAVGGGGRPGLERGWFDFDPATTQIGRLMAIDTSGEWGLSHPGVNEGIASITDTAITTKGGEAFARLTDSGSGIVGMWANGSATDLKKAHFVFFAPVNGVGKVLSIHPYSAGDSEPGSACDVARQGPPGIEWADYTFNASTGALRVYNKQIDTTGCSGLFDSSDGAVLNGTANTEVNVVLTLSGDGKTATVAVDTAVLYRITP